MADKSGQQDLRGIDIDKVAKGFADEENIFKRFCTVTRTSAREIRWYQKTSGFIDSTDTSGITASQIDNVAPGALPVVAEQTWTRNTSYVRNYKLDSPYMAIEDIKDSDVDLLATNVRDIVRGVQRRIDARIFDVLTESQSVTNINSVTTTAVGGDQWDAASGQDPIKDIKRAMRLIRTQGYQPNDAILLLDEVGEESLTTWLISTKGSSIPQKASSEVDKAVLMNILGLRVVVSSNVVTDYGVVFIPQRAITWKTFMSTTAYQIEEKGIGTKIRVVEEGEAILTDPKAVTLIIDLNT